jgi:hypothetical protein
VIRLFVTVAMLPLLVQCHHATPVNSPKTLPDMIDDVRGSIVQIAVTVSPFLNIPPQLPKPIADCFAKARFETNSCIVGTGFFVNDKGDIVTATHVLDGANWVIDQLATVHLGANVVALFPLRNGEKGKGFYRWNYEDYSIRPAGIQDKLHDVAVFSLFAPEKFRDIGHTFGLSRAAPVIFDTERPRDGEGVYACGYPMGRKS